MARETNENELVVAEDDVRGDARLRIAVDIGGTFTDLAAFDERGQLLSFGKALSTHDALVRGIRQTAEVAGVDYDQAYLFLHGSTIAINTLLERAGAKTALLTTEGFRDSYEIGRINRPDAYNLFFTKHDPLVPRSRRLELRERMMADGSVRIRLDEDQVYATVRDLEALGVEAVAIMFLHSYRNPAHEARVKEIVREVLPSAFVTASHELSQEYREFERVSTTAANAYVGPRVNEYLGELEADLTARGFRGEFFVVQSTGGLYPAADAREQCVRMLESGPAAGVIGTQALCRQLGMPDAIAFDMGGTTAKAGVISDFMPLTTSSAMVGHYDRALPIQIPMIDIFEVGTGGGSIANVIDGGGLRVGPRSAGSSPGPACYGQGGKAPTVTDANLLLGRLDPEHFLGGEMKLDTAAAQAALAAVGCDLGLDATETADGILRIAVTAMSYAVKGVTTERGLDAGSFAMVVYGGAGPLHGSAVARELGIGRVIIPFSPGHFSAYGMLFSDLRYDFVRSCFHDLDRADFAEIETLFGSMEQQGRDLLDGSVVPADAVQFARQADMRYIGQEHAVTVDLPLALFERGDRSAIKEAFDAVHLARYGTSAPNESAQFVSLRSTVIGPMAKPQHLERKPAGDEPSSAAKLRMKPVYFREYGWIETPVFAREQLQSGNRIAGPALIEEHASTTVVQPGDHLVVDGFGNLDISIGGQQ